MNKEEKNANIKVEVKVNLSGNLDEAAVQAAVMNAESLKTLALPLPVVDPEKLTLKSQIFGLQLMPITPKEERPNAPDAGKYVSLMPIGVGVIDGVSDEHSVVVNGRIHIPKNPGTVVNLEKAFFANEGDARLVCKTITLNQMKRRVEQVKGFELEIERENHEFKFLEEQDLNNRY